MCSYPSLNTGVNIDDVFINNQQGSQYTPLPKRPDKIPNVLTKISKYLVILIKNGFLCRNSKFIFHNRFINQNRKYKIPSSLKNRFRHHKNVSKKLFLKIILSFLI
jgi:hypothetical protein